MVLKILQTPAERVFPESQCGFRAERPTIGTILSLGQLQEKSREQRRPPYIAFIDLTRGLDLVGSRGLFTLPLMIGCPSKLLNIITSFHDGMQGTVQFDGSSLNPFPVVSGVTYGCVLTGPLPSLGSFPPSYCLLPLQDIRGWSLTSEDGV